MYGTIKHGLRTGVIQPFKRLQAMITWRQWNRDGLPTIFGNAMPKSGSKLLKQVLHGMCQIGPFVETGRIPIRTITIDGRLRSAQEILADLRRLQPGDVTLGYLRATQKNMAFLCRPDWAVYFIIRDPRDMLVSHVYYATEMYPGHGMHAYYTQLPDMAARLKVAIRGIAEKNISLASVAERYRRVEGWLSCPEIKLVHFEDMILNRERTIDAMLAHLETKGYDLKLDRQIAIRRIASAIDPQKSPTFRKGRVGDWHQHFDNENKQLFKDVTGDLLIQLGYEKNNDW